MFLSHSHSYFALEKTPVPFKVRGVSCIDSQKQEGPSPFSETDVLPTGRRSHKDAKKPELPALHLQCNGSQSVGLTLGVTNGPFTGVA